MKIQNPKIARVLDLSDNTKMSVELDDKIINKIKEAYSIDHIEDVHIERFFEEILEDAIKRSQ